MKRTPQWLLVLDVFVSFIIVLSNSAQAVAGRDDSGVISIDCGAKQDYWDNKTESYYEADDAVFVEYGEPHNVSLDYNTKEQIGKQLNTLRSFSSGNRNCYTLKPRQGKNTYYLVRAYFAYGNYDKKNRIPSFDLHIGVNYWATIDKRNGDIVQHEVIHVSPTDDIDVCLINTGKGIPFISLLEVWPLQNSRYDQTASSLLRLMTRSKLGMSEDATYIRYPDDIYGRSWFNRKIDNSVQINTSAAIDRDTGENTYKLPKEVLSTAVQSACVSSSLVINMDQCNSSYDYYVYLHFYDFVKRSQNQRRKMDIAFNDGISVSFTLEYLKHTTVVRNIKQGDYVGNISITSSSDSDLPAMLNAYEIYRVLPQPVNSTTDEGDVVAIQNIKKFYDINRTSWQGDPCMPINYTWEGLTCNYDSTPRITSLNLSSSNLTGVIVASFSNFTKLESLNLSENQLTGEIPESLAALSNLKYINLTNNHFDGPIPKALEDKITTDGLNFSADPMHRKRSGKSKGLVVGLSVGVPAGVTIEIGIGWKFLTILRKRKRERRCNTTHERNDRTGELSTDDGGLELESGKTNVTMA